MMRLQRGPRSGVWQPGRILIRYWGLSLLTILGLAFGFAAAIVVALEVRNELGFDRFLPDTAQVYLLRTHYTPEGGTPVSSDQSPASMARWLRTDSPAVSASTRLVTAEWPMHTAQRVAQQRFYWADANLFNVLHFKAVSGDLATALQKPDSMVLTRKMARAFFGREDVVGQTIVLSSWMNVKITAVLADFPPNTSFQDQIFISSEAGYSMLSILDSHPEWNWTSCLTFVKLQPHTSLPPAAMARIAARHGLAAREYPIRFSLTPLTQLHFLPIADSPIAARGHADTIIAMIAVALLIVTLAVVNFSELMAVQIDERRREMAIRKTLGAEAHDVFLQVMAEAAILVCLALLLAAAAVERLLPLINPVMRLGSSPWSGAGFMLACLTLGFLIAMLGALYPALALAAAHPRQHRSQGSARSDASISRSLWTVARFSLLIVLLISSQTVYQQWRFATSDALNHDARHIFIVDTDSGVPADLSLGPQVAALKGVESVAYSRSLPELRNIWPDWVRRHDGRIVQMQRQSVDPTFYRIYDVHLLAGKGFTTTYPDLSPAREVVINRAALQALGYARPQDAIGQSLVLARVQGDHPTRIIGVIDDIRLADVRTPTPPMVFDNQAAFFNRLSVKLKPGAEASILPALQAIWKRTYPTAGPMEGQFYADYILSEYTDMYQQWYVFGLLSLVGVAVSIFGLIGLSIHIFRSRRKEVAIRNALGASKFDLITLRLKPYLRPLLIANLVAGTVAWLATYAWLRTFALHVNPNAFAFVLASACTFIIALGTLAIHTALAEPARSSGPLRNLE